MKKVAVIGAGVFGTSVALELAKKFNVVLFERRGSILAGASTNNHLRYHHGYHYPRSKETALESINGRLSFEEEYGACVSETFPAYYAISKLNSKTHPKDFIKFCNDLKLPYKIEFPENEILNRSKVTLCIKTPEPVYNPEILKKIITKKIKNSTVNLRLRAEVIGGEIKENKKVITYNYKNSVKKEEFDYVVGALYSNLNIINKWFGFKKKRMLYSLMELIDIKLPITKKIGVMVLDGEFGTFLPVGKNYLFRLGHVKHSVLKQIVSDDLDTVLITNDNTLSNKDKILKASLEFYPILKKAKFVRSIFVTRVIKPNVDNTDERLTEITKHGNGIYSVLGGKVITCIDTAKKIARMIEESY